MGTQPIDVVVLTDESFQASYLASVLRMELPGLFKVRHLRRNQLGAGNRPDLVLMQEDGQGFNDARPLARLAKAAQRAPVIIVSRGSVDFAVLDRLIHGGADDVLDLAQLNTRALAAAILKAVHRRTRLFSNEPQIQSSGSIRT